MTFSVLDLEKNCTLRCVRMNFTHLTGLMLLHYLDKFETPKMAIACEHQLSF